jgi:RNA polymerase sigma factor (sigma-70 family)
VIGRQIRRRAKELSRERAGSAEVPSERQDEPDLVGDLDAARIHRALLDLVNHLPERLRQVIVGRYGLGEPGPCTLAELGRALGVTGERVRQLEQDALAWLRHPAHSWPLRRLAGQDTARDYRRALAQNAALRRARKERR